MQKGKFLRFALVLIHKKTEKNWEKGIRNP